MFDHIFDTYEKHLREWMDKNCPTDEAEDFICGFMKGLREDIQDAHDEEVAGEDW